MTTVFGADALGICVDGSAVLCINSGGGSTTICRGVFGFSSLLGNIVMMGGGLTVPREEKFGTILLFHANMFTIAVVNILAKLYPNFLDDYEVADEEGSVSRKSATAHFNIDLVLEAAV